MELKAGARFMGSGGTGGGGSGALARSLTHQQAGVLVHDINTCLPFWEGSRRAKDYPPLHVTELFGRGAVAVTNVGYLGMSLTTSAGISAISGALNRSTADNRASGSMGPCRITVCRV